MENASEDRGKTTLTAVSCGEGESSNAQAAEEAKAKLLAAIPYFRSAVKRAQQNGKMMLGILSVNPDGSGKVEAQFEADEFFDDIAAVIGAPPQTEDDDMKADARSFLERHGLLKK